MRLVSGIWKRAAAVGWLVAVLIAAGLTVAVQWDNRALQACLVLVIMFGSASVALWLVRVEPEAGDDQPGG